MPYIFGKLWHLAIIWAIRKAFQCILQGVRFLLANHTLLSPTSDNDSDILRVNAILQPKQNLAPFVKACINQMQVIESGHWGREEWIGREGGVRGVYHDTEPLTGWGSSPFDRPPLHCQGHRGQDQHCCRQTARGGDAAAPWGRWLPVIER